MATSLAPTNSESAATAALSRPAVETGGGDGNDPSVTSAAYNRMKARWEKCRMCFIGTEAVRAAGKTALPQYSQEDDARYEVRKNLAAFYNAFAKTALACVGMLFGKPLTLSKDMPQELQDLSENIDAAGTHVNVFASRLALAGMIDSHAGILIEHSRPGDPSIDMSKASAAAAEAVANGTPLDDSDEKALGLRPYFLLFKADDVIKPFYETVNGVKTLTLLILREVVTKRVGLFGTKSVTQYRIYTNDRGVISYQLWTSPDTVGGRPTLTTEPTIVRNQTDIPWSPFVAGDEVADGEWKPPLLDLADMNLQYHASITNHLSLEALAMVPTPVRIGAQPILDAEDPRVVSGDAEVGDYPPLNLGPSNTIEAPLMDGVAQPVYWLTPDVDVLAPSEKTLTATLAAMATLGAAFMSAETRAAETAEGKRIDATAQRATLGTVSTNLTDCLERAYGFMGKYRKVKGGSVTLNTDFTGDKVDPQYLAVLLKAYTEDVITLEDLRFFIQTGELPADFDAKDTIDLIARQMAKQDQERQDAADALALKQANAA